MKVDQVIIVGAGPAGLATAIQLTRYGIHPLIFERAEMGGLLLNANWVENYPGFPEGIPGPELVKRIISQVGNLNIEVKFEEVISLDYDQGLFYAKTGHKSYTSRLAVLATGTKPVRLTGFSIPENLLEMIYYEVYPLLDKEGKCIAIVGSGDAAFDYGLNLSKKNRVVILNRGTSPKCLPLLLHRAQKVSTITYQEQALIQQLVKSGPGLLIDCHVPTGVLQLYADYLVGAIGREPRLDCLSGQLHEKMRDLKKSGTIYLIGDVKNGIYRQTSIAVGDGVKSAMKICNYLKEKA